jgi:pyrroline-5-carboxylate reductase
MKALFLGYGRMGSAIGESWLKAGLVESVTAVDPYRASEAAAAIFASADLLPDEQYDLIVVAVKPSMATEAIKALPARVYAPGAAMVSVMAGVKCSTLEAACDGKIAIIRSMPNTPILLGAGCTGLYAGNEVSEDLRGHVTKLFNAVGKAYWVDSEEMLHAVTAISGSGPAYYHLFSEAMEAAGVALGLPQALAHDLAAQTAFGAASLQCQEGAEYQQLRLAVTSPKGTTDAAIRVFEQSAALRGLVEKATASAFQRSKELSEG